MTDAQQRALEALAQVVDVPLYVHPATAEILAERYRYIEPAGWRGRRALWVINDKGRAAVERAIRHRAHEAMYRVLCEHPESKVWAKRVLAWTEAVDTREPDYRIRHYIEHVAACRHAGLTPLEPREDGWTEDTVAWVVGRVERVERILRQLEEQAAIAVQRGGGITVEFRAERTARKSRHDALDAARRDDGTVDLTTYGERRTGGSRPSSTDGPAA